jgi:hypothetical protein
VNLAKCWEEAINDIDFDDGDDGHQVDPVQVDPDQPPPKPIRISCATVHPLIEAAISEIARHQRDNNGTSEDFLDALRVQVAVCLAGDIALSDMVTFANKRTREGTYDLSVEDLYKLAYATIVQAFGVADYVEQHFDG